MFDYSYADSVDYLLMSVKEPFVEMPVEVIRTCLVELLGIPVVHVRYPFLTTLVP